MLLSLRWIKDLHYYCTTTTTTTSSPLRANAWLVPPATCARCHIYSKDSRSLYSVVGLNTRELCFYRWRTGPLAIPTFDFSFMFLALGIFTTDGDKKKIKIIIIVNIIVVVASSAPTPWWISISTEQWRKPIWTWLIIIRTSPPIEPRVTTVRWLQCQCQCDDLHSASSVNSRMYSVRWRPANRNVFNKRLKTISVRHSHGSRSAAAIGFVC